MATRRYGISRGETQDQITEAVGAAVASDGIELTVDLAVGLQKSEVVMALDQIKNHIIEGNWPPA
jgi:hypothetical protein